MRVETAPARSDALKTKNDVSQLNHAQSSEGTLTAVWAAAGWRYAPTAVDWARRGHPERWRSVCGGAGTPPTVPPTSGRPRGSPPSQTSHDPDWSAPKSGDGRSPLKPTNRHSQKPRPPDATPPLNLPVPPRSPPILWTCPPSLAELCPAAENN